MTKKALPEFEFSIKRIDALPLPAERIEYKDSSMPALRLRVTPTGVKTFSFFGRARGADTPERITYGKYPGVKPEEARNWAKQLVGRMAGGVSVAAADRARRGELTLKDLYDLYFEHVRRTAKRSKYVEMLWTLYIEPTFGSRKLSDIKALHVERWHHALPGQILKRRAEVAAARQAEQSARVEEVAARRSMRRRGPDPKPKPDLSHLTTAKITGKRTANMAVECLRAMYNFALDPKRQYFVGVNPASQAFMFPNAERERFLQPTELGPFFAALAAEPSETMRDFILISLLTAMRKGNVAAMRWEEVNLKTGEWRVSGELMKNGEPHTVPLLPEAVALLEQRQASTGKLPFVFPSSRSKSGHVEDIKRVWTRVMLRANLSNLRPHDLRRTLGSWQARTGASLVLIGKSLAHKDSQSTAIYARLDLDPVRQSMGRATSAMFEAAGFKTKAEVIELPKPPRRVAKRGAKK